MRNAPEKLFVTSSRAHAPDPHLQRPRRQIKAFRAEHKDIIFKPLYGSGGAGVFHVGPEDDNLNSLLEIFTQLYREPVVVQPTCREMRQGDKRIILVDGKAAGA